MLSASRRSILDASYAHVAGGHWLWHGYVRRPHRHEVNSQPSPDTLREGLARAFELGFESRYGTLPPAGWRAVCRCPEPACINPAHMWLVPTSPLSWRRQFFAVLKDDPRLICLEDLTLLLRYCSASYPYLASLLMLSPLLVAALRQPAGKPLCSRVVSTLQELPTVSGVLPTFPGLIEPHHALIGEALSAPPPAVARLEFEMLELDYQWSAGVRPIVGDFRGIPVTFSADRPFFERTRGTVVRGRSFTPPAPIQGPARLR